MLPGRVVGSAVIKNKTRSFTLDVPSGRASLDRFEAADPMQRSIGSMEREAIERQVIAETGADRVRIGEYCCPRCDRWVDVVRDPQGWSGDRCSNC
jgi:hypothetical protein